MNPLVDVDELARELDEVVLVDARYWLGQAGRGRAAYEQGHLPGARFVDVDAELADPPAADGIRPGTHTSGRHPLASAERFAATVRRLGIDASSRVVVYDQSNGLAASRLWWLLRDGGHGDVRVLDGGFDAWVASGGELSTDEPAEGQGSFVPGPGQLPVVELDELAGLAGQGHRLVDVRAAERFRGEVEQVDPVAGHIPGAENLPATSLQTADGHFLATDELRERLGHLRAGDVVSCGSGLTASQVLLAAEVAGIDGLRLYPGSYSQWISDPARPVETSR